MLTAITRWQDGPAELRHFLLTLCAMADHSTGQGFHGQDTIGRAMGKSARTVRNLFDQLELCASSPVQVRRRARMHTSGRGRTSDEWTLSLVAPTGNRQPVSNDQPATSNPLDAPTGSELPLSQSHPNRDQPATQNGPTGNVEHDQPATHCQGSEYVDQNLLSESDPPAPAAPLPASASASAVPFPSAGKSCGSPKRAGSHSKSAASKAKTCKSDQPKPDKPAHVGFRQVVAAYFAAFEAKNQQKPVFSPADGKWVNALLDAVGSNTEEACRIVRNAFTPGRWFSGVTMKVIGSDPSKFLTAGNGQQGSSKTVPSQEGTNPDVKIDN